MARTSKEIIPTAKPKVEESDGEAEIIPATKSKPLRMKPQSTTKIDSDSEEEVQPKANAKVQPKRKRYFCFVVSAHLLIRYTVATVSR